MARWRIACVPWLGVLGCALWLAACARPQPAPPQPPDLVPVAVATPPPIQPDWNIFPDPTTGRVEVYHDGTYLGSVTGDEKEDIPTPHIRPDDRAE